MSIKQFIIIGVVVLTGCVVLAILALKGNQAAFTALCTLVFSAVSYVLGVTVGTKVTKRKYDRIYGVGQDKPFTSN